MSALKKQNFRESSFGNTEQLSQLCCLMPRLGDRPSFSVLLSRAAQQGSAQFMMRGASDDRVEARWRTAPGRLRAATAKKTGRSSGVSNRCGRDDACSEMQRATPKSGPCEFWLPDLDSNQGPADRWLAVYCGRRLVAVRCGADAIRSSAGQAGEHCGRLRWLSLRAAAL